MVAPLKFAISGAGLLGRLLAWRLLDRGHKVSLFEQSSFDVPQSAAHTAAAMISPLSEVVVSERAIYDMGIHSLSVWPQWIERLNIKNTRPILYRAKGSIVVAHHQDRNELDQFHNDLDFHLGTENQSQWLNQESLRELEPDLADQFERALLLPNEAYLDNRQLLVSLLDSIQALNGQCHERCKLDFDHLSNQVTCSNPSIDLNSFDQFIDCRGVGAKGSLPETSTSIRGIRGEILWVHTSEVHLTRPVRLMHPRYKLYIVPKPNNQYIIGATEIESEDRSPMSVQSMMELCSALYTLNPAFAEARISEIDTNLRPATLDNLPVILSHQTSDGRAITHVNGLYRHGYLLAPYIVEQTEKQLFDHD